MFRRHRCHVAGVWTMMDRYDTRWKVYIHSVDGLGGRFITTLLMDSVEGL